MSQTDALRALVGRRAPRAPDLASLQAWGQALGAALPRPAVVTFAGDLGAGKTTLVRAICVGLGVVDMTAVTSPTYALIQEYDAPMGAIVHVDLYRLRSVSELDGIGWDELVAGASVLLVEWPDRAAQALPHHRLAIDLRHDVARCDRRRLSVQWVQP